MFRQYCVRSEFCSPVSVLDAFLITFPMENNLLSSSLDWVLFYCSTKINYSTFPHTSKLILNVCFEYSSKNLT